MKAELIQKIAATMPTSDSVVRKHWASVIVDQQVPLISLLPLLDEDIKIAQRFMWTIGDVCELDSSVVAQCMPILFDLRNEMPFPGMDRSVAKWLWLTDVPESVEPDATEQLLQWMRDKHAAIACKSYSAKALYELVKDGRLEKSEFAAVLKSESRHKNKAYAYRMKKQLDELATIAGI